MKKKIKILILHKTRPKTSDYKLLTHPSRRQLLLALSALLERAGPMATALLPDSLSLVKIRDVSQKQQRCETCPKALQSDRAAFT
jgi:hypothetical protein